MVNFILNLGKGLWLDKAVRGEEDGLFDGWTLELCYAVVNFKEYRTVEIYA